MISKWVICHNFVLWISYGILINKLNPIVLTYTYYSFIIVHFSDIVHPVIIDLDYGNNKKRLFLYSTFSKNIHHLFDDRMKHSQYRNNSFNIFFKKFTKCNSSRAHACECKHASKNIWRRANAGIFRVNVSRLTSMVPELIYSPGPEVVALRAIMD